MPSSKTLCRTFYVVPAIILLASAPCALSQPSAAISSSMLAGMTSPAFWHKNVLIFRDYGAQELGSSLPHVKVIGMDGKLLNAVRVDVPGVTMVQVHAVDAIDSNGSVVISASGWSSASQHVAMLCFAGSDGKIGRVVQTNPFLAFVLRVVPDGTIWAIGADIHGMGRKSGELFRRFSGDGVVIGKWMTASEFVTIKNFHPSMQGPERGTPFIVAGGSRVGAYVSAAEEWVEFTSNAQSVLRLHIPLPENTRVERGCMTSSGAVFATIHGPTGSTLNELDRANSRWVPVAPEYSVLHSIVGCDADTLVVRDHTGGSEVGYTWMTVPSRYAP